LNIIINDLIYKAFNAVQLHLCSPHRSKKETKMSKRILMLVTSNGSMGAGGKATGIWAEELAAPYYALIDAGHSVDIASPKGGAVPLDPGSLKPAGQNTPIVERFLNDKAAMQTIGATHISSAVSASDYDAVFLPGGHGTMWDMPDDNGVKAAVESAFRAGKPVAAVCHGVSGLVGAVDAKGKPITAGRRVNSFTDAEEEAAGLTSAMPFLLETRLRSLGAHFESAPNWQPFAVRDGNLITGQNPNSSELVARHLLEALEESEAKAA
jgi:putative intracellular protease/amidase